MLAEYCHRIKRTIRERLNEQGISDFNRGRAESAETTSLIDREMNAVISTQQFTNHSRRVPTDSKSLWGLANHKMMDYRWNAELLSISLLKDLQGSFTLAVHSTLVTVVW